MAMEVDVFLIIFIPIVIGIALAVNTRVLLHFQQPEDSQFASSVFVKAIIVISLTLAWFVNILLPVDVRNSRSGINFLNMQIAWAATFIALAVFLVLLVPAAMFYHEVEGDEYVKNKRRYVLCSVFLMVFFSGGILGLSYPFLSAASIPVVQYACGTWQDGDAQVTLSAACSQGVDTQLEVKVGFQIYLIAVLCFVGWFFFVTFGGIGLSAVPLDLILSFVDRPRAVSESTFQQRRKFIGLAARTLLQQAKELKDTDAQCASGRGFSSYRKRRQVKSDYNRFQKDVHLLEEQLEHLVISKFHKGENLVVSITKLVLGILSAMLSLAWVIHVILYVIVRQFVPNFSHVSLNALFIACEGAGLYPLGVALFSLCTLYLLLCVVKGCLKFGMRIFFVFSIHPMRPKATPLNSILFNVEMMLISSAAVVQFTQAAFADYARLTDADVIFAAQIRYMTFYSWFFKNNVFVFALLAWFLLALLYLICRPRDNGQPVFNTGADQRLVQLANALKLPGSSASRGAESVRSPIASRAA